MGVARPPHLSFWDPPLFYPARNVAAFTDLMFSEGPFYWPWRAAGIAPATAFELWLLAALILDFWAFYAFLTRGLSCSPVAGGLGAYLFAFGSARAANVGHPQLLFDLFVAGALWGLARAFALVDEPGAAGRRRLALGLATLCLVLQAWGAFYPLFFSSVFLLVAVAGALGLRPARRRLVRILVADGPFLAILAGAAALALWPLARHYLAAAELLGRRDWGNIRHFAPRVLSWVVMGETSRLYGWIHRVPAVVQATGHGGTRVLGVGLVTPLLAAAGLWLERRRSSTRLLVLVSAVVIVATTVGPGGGWLWPTVARWLPGAQAIRALGRIGIYLAVPVGVGVAFLADRLRPHPRFALLALVLLAVLAVEQSHRIPSYDKLAARRRVERIASHLGPHCRTFYASSRMPLPIFVFQVDAMWAASRSGTPTINGRYGNSPPGYELYHTNETRRVLARRLDR